MIDYINGKLWKLMWVKFFIVHVLLLLSMIVHKESVTHPSRNIRGLVLCDMPHNRHYKISEVRGVYMAFVSIRQGTKVSAHNLNVLFGSDENT